MALSEELPERVNELEQVKSSLYTLKEEHP